MRLLRHGYRPPCVCRAFLLPPLLLLLLVGARLTAVLPAPENHAAAQSRRNNTAGHKGAPPDGFTIIMQTYSREDVLLKLLNHYQAVPRLRRILVVWNDADQPPPRALWQSLGPHPIPVVFKEQRKNLVRNRLQPFSEIDTDAVLMLDDDTRVSVPDLSFAFSVWKLFPEQIVGFVPRKHVTTASGVYSYGSHELQDPEIGGGDWYSMVLVSAAFFHRRYLELFQQQPAQVLALVDKTQNCDDILMNFVVALHLGAGPGAGARPRVAGVYVKPVDIRNLEQQARSGFRGLWNRPEHMLQRSYCLNRLAQIYGGMPLAYSNIVISQFGFPSYSNH